MEDTRDRISQLPEPILHHILSFLLVKDAVRMSTLSKIWTSALNSLSYLDFGEDFFYGPQDMRNLLKAVTQILVIRLKHKISVEKFWLRLPYLRRRFYYVHRWIKLLVACNVKEFDLSVGRRIYEGKQLHNKLPEVIFDAKALNVLNLVGFKIELPSHGTINLSSLRELHLRDVILDEKFIQALCVSCHNLEFLYLAWFKGLASFQVGEKNLPKLKKIKLENCPSEFQMVDIAAISLEDLTIKSYWDLKFVKITACKALKSLFLNGVAVTDKWLEKLFFSLQNLEKFYLSCCNTLTTMKISSIWLKQLIVFGCSNLVDAQVYTPNLILFAFGCCSLPTLKLKASRSLKANISFDSLETPDSDWYNSNLTNFLGSFNHSLSIKLSSKKDERIVIPQDMRVNLLPPLYATNNLHVDIEKRWKHLVVEVVDSLLWISPQLDTISFNEARVLKTLKFIHEDASNEDEKSCCASLPWKCWRHKLKQVKMQNFSCMEQQELRDYFFTNAHISEIIDVPSE